METKTLQEKLDEMDYRSVCKRLCDDIDQRMEKVTAGMADRAIWELFQNAGDVAKDCNGEKRAFIKMTLTPEEFIFAHKGKSFTYDTLNSLVKQVSSQSKEEDEDATGQYGTGFITTHSFGKVLSITGSMEKPFSEGEYIDIDGFVIDRLYTVKQEFYEKMPGQLSKVKQLALNAPTTLIAREWTELRYDLSTAIGSNGLVKALRGFQAAVKTMPYLMTINPRITEVEINNQIDCTHIKFKSYLIEDDTELKVMQVTIECNGTVETKKIYFLASNDRSDVIILPFDTPTTARRLNGMAKLFVSYPLTDTEDFGSEFIFHSSRFIPEEERNGLYLPKEEANSPQKYENNVRVLNEMTDMLFSFLKKIEHKFTEWDEILNLNFNPSVVSDPMKRDFFETYRQKWVAFFESLNVIPVDGEHRSLASGKVRLYSESIADSLSADEKEFADAVYEAAKELDDVPAKEMIMKWSHVVLTWGMDDSECFYTVQDIAQKLSANEVAIETILGFDKYIKAIDSTALFDDYKLIPNRCGKLQYRNELRDARTIPAWVADLVQPFIADDLTKFIDERFLDIYKFDTYTRNDLRKALNDALDTKARETFRKSINPQRCDDDTLVALAKLALISHNESETTYRAAAMKVITPYLGIPYELKVLPALDSDEKDIAPLPFKHLIENLLLEISTKDSDWVNQNANYIHALHQSMAKWSEYYNRNDRKGLALDYACFPNMLSTPSLAKDLRSAEDIPEEIFDLYATVMGVDLRDSLVLQDYSVFYEFPRVDTGVIAKEIEDVLAEGKFEHEAVLDIIEYVDGDSKWSALFPRIADKKADLFMKQVKPECKEGVFRLMKIEDADKLNQLADLADECDLDEILRLGKDAVNRAKNERVDFEYKKALGEYVEDFVLDQIQKQLNISLSDNDIKVNLYDVQGGQDIIIYCNNMPAYYLEVKSRWNSGRSVEMSQLQLLRCVEEADHYALICLNMAGTDHSNVNEHIYPSVSETISRIKALPNIGHLAEEAYKAAQASDETVHLGGGYSCLVPQKVIDNEGVSFNILIDCIVTECMAIINKKNSYKSA